MVTGFENVFPICGISRSFDVRFMRKASVAMGGLLLMDDQAGAGAVAVKTPPYL
jgi:hypothetical protein